MMLLQKNKLNKDDFVGYHEEALHTILSSWIYLFFQPHC
jgi:hypothetical protein